MSQTSTQAPKREAAVVDVCDVNVELDDSNNAHDFLRNLVKNEAEYFEKLSGLSSCVCAPLLVSAESAALDVTPEQCHVLCGNIASIVSLHKTLSTQLSSAVAACDKIKADHAKKTEAAAAPSKLACAKCGEECVFVTGPDHGVCSNCSARVEAPVQLLLADADVHAEEEQDNQVVASLLKYGSTGFLKEYGEYIGHMDARTALVRELKQKKSFDEFVRRCTSQSTQLVKSGGLLSLFLLPLQRMLKLELVCEQLVAYMEDWDDNRSAVSGLLSKIQELNASYKSGENIGRYESWFQVVDIDGIEAAPQCLSDDAKLLRFGNWMLCPSGNVVECYLFQDSVVWTSVPPASKFLGQLSLPGASIRQVDRNDHNGSQLCITSAKGGQSLELMVIHQADRGVVSAGHLARSSSYIHVCPSDVTEDSLQLWIADIQSASVTQHRPSVLLSSVTTTESTKSEATKAECKGPAAANAETGASEVVQRAGTSRPSLELDLTDEERSEFEQAIMMYTNSISPRVLAATVPSTSLPASQTADDFSTRAPTPNPSGTASAFGSSCNLEQLVNETAQSGAELHTMTQLQGVVAENERSACKEAEAQHGAARDDLSAMVAESIASINEDPTPDVAAGPSAAALLARASKMESLQKEQSQLVAGIETLSANASRTTERNILEARLQDVVAAMDVEKSALASDIRTSSSHVDSGAKPSALVAPATGASSAGVRRDSTSEVPKLSGIVASPAVSSDKTGHKDAKAKPSGQPLLSRAPSTPSNAPKATTPRHQSGSKNNSIKRPFLRSDSAELKTPDSACKTEGKTASPRFSARGPASKTSSAGAAKLGSMQPLVISHRRSASATVALTPTSEETNQAPDGSGTPSASEPAVPAATAGVGAAPASKLLRSLSGVRPTAGKASTLTKALSTRSLKPGDSHPSPARGGPGRKRYMAQTVPPNVAGALTAMQQQQHKDEKKTSVSPLPELPSEDDPSRSNTPSTASESVQLARELGIQLTESDLRAEESLASQDLDDPVPVLDDPPADLEQELSGLQLLLSTKNSKWTHRARALLRLQRICRSHFDTVTDDSGPPSLSLRPLPQLSALLEQFIDPFKVQLSELRSKLVADTCSTIGVMATTFAHTSLFRPFSLAWAVPMCSLAKNAKKAMSEPGHTAMQTVMQQAHVFELVQLLLKIANTERSDAVKQCCVEYLTLAMQWKEEEFFREGADEKEKESERETWLSQMDELVSKLLATSTQTARQRTRQLFYAYWKRFPLRAEKVYRSLKSSTQTLLYSAFSDFATVVANGGTSAPESEGRASGLSKSASGRIYAARPMMRPPKKPDSKDPTGFKQFINAMKTKQPASDSAAAGAEEKNAGDSVANVPVLSAASPVLSRSGSNRSLSRSNSKSPIGGRQSARLSGNKEEEEKKRPLSRSGSTNRILSPLGQRLSPVRESKTLEREREGQLRTLASKVAALEASNRLVVEALERHKGELDSLRQFKEAQLASEDVNGSLIELNQKQAAQIVEMERLLAEKDNSIVRLETEIAATESDRQAIERRVADLANEKSGLSDSMVNGSHMIEQQRERTSEAHAGKPATE